jgi:hypothetical protein
MNFRLWRGDKNDGGLKDVQVEVNEGEVVLDVSAAHALWRSTVSHVLHV